MIDEVEQLRQERDRYASLVGSAYNDDGQVIPALENAANQADLAQMAQEVRAVIGFLKDNRP